MLTLPVILIHGVIGLSKVFQNNTKKIGKCRTTTSNLSSLSSLLEAYGSYKNKFKGGLNPENYFRNHSKAYKVNALKLVEAKFI